MSQTSKWHRELTNGVGKCSVPMWSGDGCPAGFCDAPAYGEQTAVGKHAYSGYVPALACPAHGGPPAPIVKDPARLALAEKVREACAAVADEAAKEHSQMHEQLDRLDPNGPGSLKYAAWSGQSERNATAIRALDLSKLVEGE